VSAWTSRRSWPAASERRLACFLRPVTHMEKQR
jgi:hypothetical protein